MSGCLGCIHQPKSFAEDPCRTCLDYQDLRPYSQRVHYINPNAEPAYTLGDLMMLRERETRTAITGTLVAGAGNARALAQDAENRQQAAYLALVARHEELQKDGKPMLLSTDPAARKAMPITTGVLDYFPLAIAEVAKCSKTGNDQHNPGQPLHWDKTKSTDHADCIGRHLIDRGSLDTDGIRHSAKLAWRALALLQIELEAACR